MLNQVSFQPKFPVLFCFPHFQNQMQTRALHLDSSKMVISVISKDVASFDIGFNSSLQNTVTAFLSLSLTFEHGTIGWQDTQESSNVCGAHVTC